MDEEVCVPGGLTGSELGVRCALGLLAYVVVALVLGVRAPAARRWLLRVAGGVICAGGAGALAVALLTIAGGGMAWGVVWVFTLGYVHANALLAAYGAPAAVAAASGGASLAVGGALLLAGGRGPSAHPAQPRRPGVPAVSVREG